MQTCRWRSYEGLCVWLLLNSRVLPEGVAEQADRLLPDGTNVRSNAAYGAEHAAKVRGWD